MPGRSASGLPAPARTTISYEYSRRGLRTLARRTLIAAAFPAAVFILYLLLQGVLSLLLRS